MLIPVLLLTAVLGGADPAQPAAATDQQPATRPARLSQAQIEQLLGQLGHPRYSVREDATQQLCTLDADQLPDLVQRYRAETRYELKRRIRYIIESVFHHDQIAGRNGFIGIEVYQRVMADLTDPTTNATTRGVIVKNVKPGFGAERAGLQNNDVIIAFDGKVIPEDPTTLSFIQMVGSHAPGTTVGVRVFRSAETRTVTADLGNEPLKLLEGAKLDAIAQDVTWYGLWIVAVGPGSQAAALGLQPNEILRSLDGNRLGAINGQPVENLLRGIKPGSKVTLEVTKTKAVDHTVRLGKRPPEFIDLKDKAEAQGRFLQWWQEQGGDLSLRPQDNPGSRMVLNFNGQPAPARLLPESSVIP